MATTSASDMGLYASIIGHLIITICQGLLISIIPCTRSPRAFSKLEGAGGMFAQRIEFVVETNSSSQLRRGHVVLGLRLVSSLITAMISTPDSNVDLYLPTPAVARHWPDCTWPSTCPEY
jgi:hypothetical protein